MVDVKFEEELVKVERSRHLIARWVRQTHARQRDDSRRQQMELGGSGAHYEKLSHQKRIEIVYSSVIHKMSLRQIS